MVEEGTTLSKQILVISGEMNSCIYFTGVIDFILLNSYPNLVENIYTELNQYRDQGEENELLRNDIEAIIKEIKLNMQWDKVVCVGGGAWPGYILCTSDIGKEKDTLCKHPTKFAEVSAEDPNLGKINIPSLLKFIWMDQKKYILTEYNMMQEEPPYMNIKPLEDLFKKVDLSGISKSNRKLCSSFSDNRYCCNDVNCSQLSEVRLVNEKTDISVIEESFIANIQPSYCHTSSQLLDPVMLPSDAITLEEYESSKFTFMVLQYNNIPCVMSHTARLREADIRYHINKCKNKVIISGITDIDPVLFNSEICMNLILAGYTSASEYFTSTIKAKLKNLQR